MYTKLQDSDVTKHIHDLADANNGELNVQFAEDCVQRFIRVFADTDMREDYEFIWMIAAAEGWHVESPGCPENCRCRF